MYKTISEKHEHSLEIVNQSLMNCDCRSEKLNNSWITFEEFIAQNKGLPHEFIETALKMKDLNGQNLIPRLHFGDTIYVSADSSERLMSFALNESSSTYTHRKADKKSETISNFTGVKENEYSKIEKLEKLNKIQQTHNIKTISICEIKKAYDKIGKNSQPKAIAGYKGLYISSSKSKIIFKLRSNKNETPFKLTAFSLGYSIRDEDIDTIKKAHARFRNRLEANMFWKDLNYLINGTYFEINTFEELLTFYMSKVRGSYKQKVNRIMKKYFSGNYGARKLSSYCVESFETDFLNRQVSNRQRSDRNEIIKIISAAINKAKGQINVKVDVQTLIGPRARSRTATSDNKPPMLSTLCLYIYHAYKLDHKELGLELIIQYMCSLRVAATDALEWAQVHLDRKFIELPQEKSKTDYKKHPIPQVLASILRAEKEKQSANSSLAIGTRKYVFESKKRKGQCISNLDNSFNTVKEHLIKNADVYKFSEEQLEDIKNFTRHQTRDLVESELLKVGASDAQKEKCLGRAPSDVGIAYADLSIDTLSKLKDKMVENLQAEFPKIRALFKYLIESKEGYVLESWV
ncbi:hypothetical protein L1267_08095 [Pseudoalteromonas sp. OFAV1]|uniref:hypothetical protein n=1 Tax=Pseudoalteromonas sp. OFAV1 TaxID=2908892 RepID=UPI001F1960EE|nr:hypothetical protein [Pseudoalteromonas sp. OFAV1]MCF2900367.1 hypothetical protein [Pseudoalteromonas sp. OFAV1]